MSVRFRRVHVEKCLQTLVDSEVQEQLAFVCVCVFFGGGVRVCPFNQGLPS